MTSAIGIEINSEPNVRIRVGSRRWAISVEITYCFEYASPRFPVNTPPIHETYCSTHERLSPKVSRRSSSDSCVALFPSMTVAMSPPTLRRRTKITTDPVKADITIRMKDRMKTRITLSSFQYMLQIWRKGEGPRSLSFVSYS